MTRQSLLCLLVCSLICPWALASSTDKPNIVLILMDNLGYGEVGAYGGGVLRGAPTPRIDQLAAEGVRLTNFNVEAQCTPSRSALMTGRYPIRSGTSRIPSGGAPDGLTLWEVTLAEVLSRRGYATGIWGKWHLGSSEARFPTHQGFDEWYGVPRTYDEAMWSGSDHMEGLTPAIGSQQGWSPSLVPAQYIYEARAGEPAKKVAELNLQTRRTLDAEITRRATDFIQRNAKAGKPFFAYIPYSLVHMPAMPNPAFEGRTGNGSWADALAEMDDNTGRILDALREAGVADNTLVIFTSDNGGEATSPWEGANGPWRGTYFTAMEASLRAPFILRWPGKAPVGMVSNDIVQISDLFTTLGHAAGAELPDDRPIDGVDQLPFLTGQQPHSARDSVPAYVGERLYAVKWRNWKVHFIWQETMYDPPQQLPIPKIINLLTDLREEHNVAATNSWVAHPAMKLVGALNASLKQYPPIPPGSPDPYQPPR